jgi:plasmid replication initiation protein
MNEVAILREKILVMSELSNIRAELVSIADRVERIPETLLQIELMHRDVQVALGSLRKMTATTDRTDDTDLRGTFPQVEPL